MDKKKIVIACALFAFALVIGVYASGFTWRQVLFGIIAVFTWQIGEGIWRAAFPKTAFRRMQFRIGLDNLGLALQRAGLYEGEEGQAASVLAEAMQGKGWIVFTWLESDFYFINTNNHYSSGLEVSIDLPCFGARAPKHGRELSDLIEFRATNEAYELVLLTREQRYSWPEGTESKGLVLLKLPYMLLREFQRSGEPWQSHKKASEILASISDMKYRDNPDVPSAWDYHNEYVSLHWWTL